MTPVLKPLKITAKMQNIADDWDRLHREITSSTSKLSELTEQIKEIGEAAGNSEALKQAIIEIKRTVQKKDSLTNIINSSLYIRALGAAALEIGAQFPLNQALFSHIDKIRSKPSVIFLEDLRQYFLLHYDHLTDFNAVKDWLLSALKKRNQMGSYDPYILSIGGAKWFVGECDRRGIDFNSFATHIGLDNYQSGRFLTVAQQIYYVEQLKKIPVNKPHPLLEEVQKVSVYSAPYDERGLLGHEILKTLIGRAPTNNVDDSWRNVVMQIAGDPRIPKSHPRYQQWWLHLDHNLRLKVVGWLSRFDLRLFLEAMEDYARVSGNHELARMYPARKRFLEGLLTRKLVIMTRLYLSTGFRIYLNKHYKKEHLPEISKVSTGDKSIIYVQLEDNTHLIEGSHSAKLWIYKGMPEQMIIKNYTKKSVSYRDLTSGLAEKMYDENGRALLVDSIIHNPNLTWQNKTIEAMKKAGVTVNPEDVLTEGDYREYKRKFGVTYYE